LGQKSIDDALRETGGPRSLAAGFRSGLALTVFQSLGQTLVRPLLAVTDVNQKVLQAAQFQIGLGPGHGLELGVDGTESVQGNESFFEN
jgi:hypothetical protein